MENVPAGASNAEVTSRHAAERPTEPKNDKKKKLIKRITGAVVGVLLLGAIVFGVWSLYRTSTAANIDTSKYQAVFLTNGQVYFGKLQSLNGSYMKLTDIFYLQATDTTDGANPQETTDEGSDVQLIKLGSEIHAPNDEMIIGKEQILFFENLKKDGSVSQSIDKYKNDQKK